MQPSPIELRDLMARRITLFTHARITARTRRKTITLAEYVEKMRKRHWRRLIEKLRSIAVPEEQNRFKTLTLPVLKFGGVFNGHATATLITPSGLMALDLDHLGTERARIREALIQDPHSLIINASPRDLGLKLIVATTATDADSHRRCFDAATEYFLARLPLSDPHKQWDHRPSSISSNCFVSDDRNVWVSDRPVTPFAPLMVPAGGPRPMRKKGGGIISVRSGESGGSDGSISHSPHVPLSHADIRMKAEERVRSLDPRLRDVFDRWINNRSVVRGRRDEFLTKVIPGLFCAAATPVVVDLLMLHYDYCSGIWCTRRNEHLTAVIASLRSWEDRYRLSLPTPARSVYESYRAEAHKGAFRICRDLAIRIGDGGWFFASRPWLAPRLGQECDPLGGGHPQTARRALHVLVCDRAIELIKEGERLTEANKGTQLRGAEWRWLLG